MIRQSVLLRRILLPLLTLVLAVPAAVLTAAAQQVGPMKPPQTSPQQGPIHPPAQKSQEQQPQYSVKVQSQVVQVNAVVTDQDGNIITGLKQGNFRILVDGQQVPIANFAPNNAPITIVLLLEYSARFFDLWAYYSQYLASSFAEHLGPNDWCALVIFDLKPTIVVDFTRNKREIENAIQTLGFPGFSESNTFDALIDTVNRLKDVQGKKAILLVGTGQDTFSKHNLDQTYSVLKQTNVTVFCMNAAEMLAVRNGMDTSINFLQAQNQMNYFAKLTGGMAWSPRFEGELPDDFNSLVSFLRNQYSIGFNPPDSSRDGKFHKIKIDVIDNQGNPLMVANKKGKEKKVVVYAREGFIAPKVESAAN